MNRPLAILAATGLAGLVAACSPGALGPGVAVPSTPYATPVGGPTPDPYCNEAIAQAQDAARIAYATGSPLDISRAQNTDGFARRDCRG